MAVTKARFFFILLGIAVMTVIGLLSTETNAKFYLFRVGQEKMEHKETSYLHKQENLKSSTSNLSREEPAKFKNLAFYDNETSSVYENLTSMHSGHAISSNKEKTNDIMNFLSRPRIMIAGNCVGSTATLIFVRKILNAHGIQNYPSDYEILQPVRNWAYKQILQGKLPTKLNTSQVGYEEVMLEALSHMDNEARSKNQTLVFKGNWEIIAKNTRLVEGLKKMGALFTAIYRSNILVVCVCFARDCFDFDKGYPVFANNGTRTDLCIERRVKDVQVKAMLKKPVECMTSKLNQRNELMGNTRGLIFPSKIVSTESLFEFEYSDDEIILEKSKRAWTRFLKPFLGKMLDKDKILGVLQEYMNSRSPPALHEDVIYNMDEVLYKLKRDPYFLESFVRLPEND